MGHGGNRIHDSSSGNLTLNASLHVKDRQKPPSTKNLWCKFVDYHHIAHMTPYFNPLIEPLGVESSPTHAYILVVIPYFKPISVVRAVRSQCQIRQTPSIFIYTNFCKLRKRYNFLQCKYISVCMCKYRSALTRRKVCQKQNANAQIDDLWRNRNWRLTGLALVQPKGCELLIPHHTYTGSKTARNSRTKTSLNPMNIVKYLIFIGK